MRKPLVAALVVAAICLIGAPAAASADDDYTPAVPTPGPTPTHLLPPDEQLPATGGTVSTEAGFVAAGVIAVGAIAVIATRRKRHQ